MNYYKCIWQSPELHSLTLHFEYLVFICHQRNGEHDNNDDVAKHLLQRTRWEELEDRAYIRGMWM